MNYRERFKSWVEFEDVDRPVRWEWAFRADTTRDWRVEGLPPEVPEVMGWSEFFDLDPGAPFVPEVSAPAVEFNTGLVPPFDEEILEETSQTVIKRDEWRTVSRDSKTGMSMPQFLSFGVRSREDFREFRKRWNSTDTRRYPSDWKELKTAWRKRDYPLHIRVDGWYGLLRRLMGMEQLSYAFFDQPDLIEEISEFWGDFLIEALEPVLKEIELDYLLFWEDLAYKTAPLLSPEQFRRFFLPHYRRVVERFSGRGVLHFMVDSDGNPELIFPLWLDAGIDIIGPCEVAADMDVVRIGNEYPELVLVGGIDKREIAKGRKSIDAEVMRRVPLLLERGGYIPTLDHATIPGISLDDYRYYREFLHKVCEG